MAAIRHLRFVIRVFGAPTKSICWRFSICKIWLYLEQYFRQYAILMLCALNLKCVFTPPKSRFGEYLPHFTSIWGAVSTRPQNDTFLRGNTLRDVYTSLKSDNGCGLGAIKYSDSPCFSISYSFQRVKNAKGTPKINTSLYNYSIDATYIRNNPADHRC